MHSENHIGISWQLMQDRFVSFIDFFRYVMRGALQLWSHPWHHQQQPALLIAVIGLYGLGFW